MRGQLNALHRKQKETGSERECKIKRSRENKPTGERGSKRGRARERARQRELANKREREQERERERESNREGKRTKKKVMFLLTTVPEEKHKQIKGKEYKYRKSCGNKGLKTEYKKTKIKNRQLCL